ncbi:MAG: hypothetical protein WC659_05905, partial [Patescibacteria group bacterium]
SMVTRTFGLKTLPAARAIHRVWGSLCGGIGFHLGLIMYCTRLNVDIVRLHSIMDSESFFTK